jgi:DNA-binding PadR family transcriptional regulator
MAGMTVKPTPPLTPAAFQVLLALACGHAHGYAVMQFVEEVTGGAVKLGPGTLYRTIARLLADGLVEETGSDDPDAPHDARRRYYRLTALGRQAAESEAELLERIVAAAAEGGLLPAEGAA